MRGALLPIRRSGLVTVFAAAALTLWAQPAGAARKPVRAGYYGVNYSRVMVDSAPVRERQLAAIAGEGIRQVRATLPWRALEPNPPLGATHTYEFGKFDQVIGEAARDRLRVQATFAYVPWWASGAGAVDQLACSVFHSTSTNPGNLSYYAKAAGAMARRYGDRGTFWRDHPDLPYRPIHLWEIWNEPNLAAYWCPTPQPERYADMFALASRSIKAADPRARTVVGGLSLESPSGKYMDPGTFLRRATKHDPAMMSRADAVAVHLYPYAMTPALDVVQRFRQELEDGGVPDSMPMLVNELGWSTRGGGAVTEDQRARSFAVAAKQLPRTNCHVTGMLPHAWTTSQASASSREDWFGIADPSSSRPYPSAGAYGRAIALMRGKTDRKPPRRRLDVCGGDAGRLRSTP